MLSPQQYSSVPASAQVWFMPTPSSVTAPAGHDTVVGEVRSTNVPSPTSPYALRPQHETLVHDPAQVVAPPSPIVIDASPPT